MVIERLSASNIQVAYLMGMGLDKAPARRHGFAHQHIKGAVSLSGILDRDKKQSAVAWVHRCIPQLFWVHLTQSFKTRDGELVGTLILHIAIFFCFAISISHLVFVHQAIQRRLGEIQMALFDQWLHVPEEK